MKILIIRLSSIGDIILTEPVVRHLREVYPGSEIDYLTKAQFVPLVRSMEGIDSIIPFYDHKRSLEELRKNKYDIIIDLHSKPKTWLLKLFLPARKKVTYNKRHLQRLMMVKKIRRTFIDSTVDLYFTVFPKLKIDIPRHKYYPRITAPQGHSSLVSRLRDELRENDRQYIAVFPGATHNTKCYPVYYLAEFINQTASDSRYRFVILGSVRDTERSERLEEMCEIKPLNWCGRFDLEELIKVMSLFDLVITNDSGPMHIAAALQKKQIAIFGATHPSLGFRPLNENAIILQSFLDCRPCSLHGGEKCPLSHFECMKSIKPGLLRQALASFQ